MEYTIDMSNLPHKLREGEGPVVSILQFVQGPRDEDRLLDTLRISKYVFGDPSPPSWACQVRNPLREFTES